MQEDEEGLLGALWIKITNFTHKDVKLSAFRFGVIERDFEIVIEQFKPGETVRSHSDSPTMAGDQSSRGCYLYFMRRVPLGSDFKC